MTLKSGLEQGKDYYMVSHSNWLKIFSGFGGAPEIPIFMYNIKEKIEKPDGEIEEKIVERKHDFEPIKINVHMTHQGGQDLLAE